MNEKQRKGEERPRLSAEAELSDGELVRRVRAGDTACFELLMRRNNTRVYRLARSVLRNAAEAEDAVQSAYLRAYEKLDDFRGPDGFRSWLGRIVLNEALGRLRAAGRVVSLEDFRRQPGEEKLLKLAETLRSTRPDPEYLAANSQLRDLLEDAIDTLPQMFRTVFILRAVEGMSVADTADVLGIAPETVKTRFHRARKRLRAVVGATIDDLMPALHPFAGERCDRTVASVLGRLDASPGEPPPGAA